MLKANRFYIADLMLLATTNAVLLSICYCIQ